jgi:hypothetical protein
VSDPKRRRRFSFGDDASEPDERPRHERWGVRSAYWLLLALVALGITLTVRFPENTWIERFGPNFVTDTLGILLTLVFVQRFLDQQDRARRLRASIGGLRKATRALVRVNHMWRMLIKGCLPQPPEIPPGTVHQLYAPHFTEHLIGLDPTCLREPEDPDAETWLRWAVGELHAMQETLRTVIVAYGASLDPEYVEAMDDVVDDRFIVTLSELAEAEPSAPSYRVTLNRTRGMREEHFSKLLRLIETHNRLAGEAAKRRSRSSMPRSGSMGLALSADADIRVPSTLERRVWNAPPMPAALRPESARTEFLTQRNGPDESSGPDRGR